MLTALDNLGNIKIHGHIELVLDQIMEFGMSINGLMVHQIAQMEIH